MCHKVCYAHLGLDVCYQASVLHAQLHVGVAALALEV